MKQTAVEWLCDKYHLKQDTEIVRQTKEMEKQQIVEAHAVGRLKECSGINTDGEQYYNQTFNK